VAQGRDRGGWNAEGTWPQTPLAPQPSSLSLQLGNAGSLPTIVVPRQLAAAATRTVALQRQGCFSTLTLTRTRLLALHGQPTSAQRPQLFLLTTARAARPRALPLAATCAQRALHLSVAPVSLRPIAAASRQPQRLPRSAAHSPRAASSTPALSTSQYAPAHLHLAGGHVLIALVTVAFLCVRPACIVHPGIAHCARQ
jgi:hypothetical protein